MATRYALDISSFEELHDIDEGGRQPVINLSKDDEIQWFSIWKGLKRAQLSRHTDVNEKVGEKRFRVQVTDETAEYSRGLTFDDASFVHMGGCQNHGPLSGPLDTRCRITKVSTTDHHVDNHPYV